VGLDNVIPLPIGFVEDDLPAPSLSPLLRKRKLVLGVCSTRDCWVDARERAGEEASLGDVEFIVRE
jgi:hypothetical protein